MAEFYTSNYKAARIDRPNDKFKKGETGGKERLLIGDIVVPADLANNDVIKIGTIPANSRIVGGKLLINKSLGVTGILSIGHEAFKDEEGNEVALNNTGVTAVADGGGQAAYATNGAAQTVIQKRCAEGIEIYAHCSEAVNGTVDDALATFIIEYVND